MSKGYASVCIDQIPLYPGLSRTFSDAAFISRRSIDSAVRLDWMPIRWSGYHDQEIMYQGRAATGDW